MAVCFAAVPLASRVVFIASVAFCEKTIFSAISNNVSCTELLRSVTGADATLPMARQEQQDADA